MVDRLKALIARIRRWKAVRVAEHYAGGRGPILAGGLAYHSLFAVFAALWAAFSIAGSVVSGDLPLQNSILRVIRRAAPGLIDDGNGSGAIDPDVLLSASIYNVSGIIAIAVLVFIALGWLSSVRDAVRELFELPGSRTNFALQKLIDLGLGIGFGVLLIVAAGLSFAGTIATEWVLGSLGIGSDSVPGAIGGRIVTLLVMVLIYAVALGVLFRLLSGIRAPWPLLRHGVVVGAIGLGVLTAAGTLLLGGATSNPLIASFAVVAGLLISFNLASQVVLVAASWIAVGVSDAGIVLDKTAAAQRLERARELVAANTPPHEPEPERRGWFRRVFARRPGPGRDSAAK
jgi:membrane protein